MIAPMNIVTTRKGQPAPWEVTDIIYPNYLMSFEDHFLVDFTPFLPLEPIFKNVTQIFLGIPHMLKLKFEDMRKELNNN